MPGLAGPAVAQGTPESLDLAAAVELALAQNPAFLAVEEQRREVAGGVEEARADAFPQLTWTGAWSRSRNPSLLNSPDFEEFLDAFPGGEFEPREQQLHQTLLELSQPVFTWGKVGAAIELARTVETITGRRVDSARLDTALAAATAFFDVLAARRELETLEIQEHFRRETLGVVQARYDLGEAVELELLRAQASLAEVAPMTEEVRGRVAVAESRLAQVLGLKARGVPELAHEASLPPEAPPAEPLFAAAARLRPELDDLALQQDALSQQQRIVRADGKPRLELNGAYGRTARLVENIDDSLFADWRVSLDFSWAFFDGGRRAGQLAQLESRRRQLELEQQDLESRVRLEIETSLAGYRSARARWRAAGIAADAAREASRVARESYQEGVALQTDWLDAQEQETRAELLLVDAYYDAQVERARLLRAAGRLPSEDFP